jgi:hypothetical protein
VPLDELRRHPHLLAPSCGPVAPATGAGKGEQHELRCCSDCPRGRPWARARARATWCVRDPSHHVGNLSAHCCLHLFSRRGACWRLHEPCVALRRPQSAPGRAACSKVGWRLQKRTPLPSPPCSASAHAPHSLHPPRGTPPLECGHSKSATDEALRF